MTLYFLLRKFLPIIIFFGSLIVSIILIENIPTLMNAQGLVWIPSCTGNGGRWGPPEYYDGFGCPDGWYHVNGGWASENGTVWFPLCPSSGTRLHGEWRTTVFLEDNFDGEVRVENGVIVERR